MTPRLLIVDDEKTQREGLRAALEPHYEVYLAEDARKAMALLGQTSTIPGQLVVHRSTQRPCLALCRGHLRGDCRQARAGPLLRLGYIGFHVPTASAVAGNGAKELGRADVELSAPEEEDDALERFRLCDFHPVAMDTVGTDHLATASVPRGFVQDPDPFLMRWRRVLRGLPVFGDEALPTAATATASSHASVCRQRRRGDRRVAADPRRSASTSGRPEGAASPSRSR